MTCKQLAISAVMQFFVLRIIKNFIIHKFKIFYMSVKYLFCTCTEGYHVM